MKTEDEMIEMLDGEECAEDEAAPTMSDSELVAVVMEEAARGIGGNLTSNTDQDISLPLDYYLGRLPGLSPALSKDINASRYVSMDIMDSVEASIAEIMPTFEIEDLALFSPVDGDIEQAQTESEIANYLFMHEYDGFEVLQTALRDCMLHRNCTAKAYWDERIEVEYETFDDIPEMALAQVLEPTSEDQVVDIIEQYVTEEADDMAVAYTQSAQYAMDMQSMEQAESMAGDPQAQQMAQQNPEMAQQIMSEVDQSKQKIQQAVIASQDKYSIKIRRSTKVGKPVILSLPPEQTIVAGDHRTPTLQDVRFCAHEVLETQSSLVAQGVPLDVVQSLPSYNSDVESYARSRNKNEEDYESAHESTRLIRVFECYPLIDFDGDGIAERRKVLVSGNKLLKNEEWQSVPLVGGCIIIMPHKYKGISFFDRIKNIQDAKTPVFRAIIDGVRLSSNPRVGVVDGQGNIDDLLASRTGGVVRAKTPGAFFEMPNPQVPQSSYTMLDLMDKVRRDRGGGAVDSANSAQSVQSAGGLAVDRVMSALELTNALFAKTFAETFVRGLFIQIHSLLREHQKGEVSARVGGKWMTTVPAEWRKRTSVSIQVGSSQGERLRRSAAMNDVVGKQTLLAETGSIMFSEEKLYLAMTESMRLAGIKDPDRYLVDPSSEEGQAANQAKQQQAAEDKQKEEGIVQETMAAQKQLADAEMIKGQADMQNNMVKIENEKLKANITALKDRMTAMKDAGDLQFKREELKENVALKLTEMELTANRDLNQQNNDNKRENEI